MQTATAMPMRIGFPPATLSMMSFRPVASKLEKSRGGAQPYVSHITYAVRQRANCACGRAVYAPGAAAAPARGRHFRTAPRGPVGRALLRRVERATLPCAVSSYPPRRVQRLNDARRTSPAHHTRLSLAAIARHAHAVLGVRDLSPTPANRVSLVAGHATRYALSGRPDTTEIAAATMSARPSTGSRLPTAPVVICP